MTKITRLIVFLASGYTYSPKCYLLLTILMLIFGLAVPVFIEIQKTIIDRASTFTSDGNFLVIIFPFLIGYFVFYYIDTVSAYLSRVLSDKVLHNVEKNVMRAYLKDVSNVEFKAFENADIQDTLMRLAQTQRMVYSQSITFFPNILRNIISLGGVFYFVVISGVWWAFPLAIVISIPSFYFNKKRTEYARQVWSQDSFDIRYSEYLNDTLLNREAAIERRFFGFTGYLSSIWESLFRTYNKKKIVTFIKSSVATGIAMCFSMSIILVIGLAMLGPLQTGMITIGLYAAVLVAVSSTMNMSISAIIREYANIPNMQFLLEDKSKLANTTIIDIKPIRSKDMIELENIVFDDVWFAYPETENWILKGTSFEIKKNEHHALIGLNGAGKTTITKLMLGLYSPDKGSIYINDKDIKSYDYSQVNALFGTIQQNFARYKDTLGTNIGLYKLASRDLTETKLNNTLEKCETTDISALCKGDYNTVLSPEFTGGIMLSGGEWQKIALSRALCSDRRFIILDEPTAALDPLAEVRFYNIYHRLMTGYTCLFITHRLGSTYLFQNCFVLSEGKIVESGSHQELMQQSGNYRILYETQKDWYRETQE